MSTSTQWILWSRDDPDLLDQRPAPELLTSPGADGSSSGGSGDAELPGARPGRSSWGRAVPPPSKKLRLPGFGEPEAATPGGGAAPGGKGKAAVRPAPKRPPAGFLRSTRLSGAAAVDPAEINEIIDKRAVSVVFQPVVDVVFDQIAGFEALARGPKGPFTSPVQLFAAARAEGRAGELDWICRALAFRTFMEADLPASMSLFVNVEPDSLISPCPEDLLPVVWDAETRLRVFVDIPGRALSRHPREVLQTVRRARAARWGVSLDDTEFSSAGLSLLPVAEPDVIRLHHSMIDTELATGASALTAAMSEMHYNQATLLVENVEDVVARSLGAGIGGTFQQGHLFGKAGSLPKKVPSPRRTIQLLNHQRGEPTSPYAIVRGMSDDRVHAMDTDGVTTLVLAMAHHAANSNPVPVVAAVLPRDCDMHVTGQTSYRMMLERAPLTVLLGPGMSRYEDWNACVADLPANHTLATDLCIVQVTPSSCSVLAAHPSDDPRPGRWDVALSQDPAVCRRVVRELLHAMDYADGGVLNELNRARVGRPAKV